MSAGAPERHRMPCPQCGGTGCVPLSFDAAKLVTAVANHVGSNAFTCRQLCALAQAKGGTLEEAIDTLGARKLGKRLHRINGIVFGGVRIEKIGEESAGVIWRVFTS